MYLYEVSGVSAPRSGVKIKVKGTGAGGGLIKSAEKKTECRP